VPSATPCPSRGRPDQGRPGVSSPLGRSPWARRRCLPLLLLVVLSTLAAGVLPAQAAPATRDRGRAIEVLSPYQVQSTCQPTAKPGVLAFERLVRKAYVGTGTAGIVRACRIGGRSEHKEGRAWDWSVNYSNTTQRAQVANLTAWLMRTDAHGNRYAMARRLGVQYMIWNRHIWSTSQAGAGWRPYTGPDPHTGHVHFSFGWAGAMAKTSYWTGKVAPVWNSAKGPGPRPAPPAPAPAPAPRPTPQPVPQPVPPAPQTTPPPTTPPPTTPPPTTPPPTTPPPTTPRPPTPAPTTPPPTVPPPVVPDSDVLTSGTVAVDVAAGRDGPQETAFRLEAGRRYRLLVTGSYRYGGGAMMADAECSAWPQDGAWRRTSQWEGTPGHDHLDLRLGLGADEWTAIGADSRGCSPSHLYLRTVTATVTGPLRLLVADDDYADNSGSLHLAVTAL
jgi:hypothetical protein